MARRRTYKGEPVRSYRYRVLESEGFSPAECDWYARRSISGPAVRWLRRARVKWLRMLTPAQRKAFMPQIDDYYGHIEEVEDKHYSPRLKEERAAVLALWADALGGFVVRGGVK